MKNKIIIKDWEKLVGKNLPTIEIETSTKNINWIFELLGWKENVRRTN